MRYVIPPPITPSIPVAGGGFFPVRRIWCVGRNYLDHVKEMGNDPAEPPFFFTKPSDAVIASHKVPYPSETSDLHHEVELLLAMKSGGTAIDREDALDHVWGAGVSVDLTRRDLQSAAKKAGRPWAMAKGFDSSAPVGPLVPVTEAHQVSLGRIWLDLNGTRRQEADLGDMIWPVADIVASLSRYVEICPGDVILTGTPAGVGALQGGDRVTCGVEGFPELSFEMVDSV